MKAKVLTAALMASSILGTIAPVAHAATYNPDPATTKTPVTTTLELPENGGSNPAPIDPVNPTDPDNPNGGNNPDGNKPNNPTGPFGIAYQPGQFATEKTVLQESGAQSIAFKSKDPHVGVKDKTRLTRGWNLSAQLEWNNALPGSTIKTAAQSTVQINSGSEEGGKLTAQSGSEVTGVQNLVINDKSQNVMTAAGNAVKNDVFDYSLGKTTLEIADAGAVEAGTYTGNVVWTLAATA